MTDHDLTPSPETLARAEAMLPALTEELRRGVRRRAARQRAVGAALVLALLATGVLVATLPRPSAIPAHPGAGTVAVAPTTGATPSLIEVVRANDVSMIEVIRDAPDASALASIYATPSVDLASMLVNDEELLNLLDSIGRPTGLVRAGGRVWLTAAVTDEEIEEQRHDIRDEI